MSIIIFLEIKDFTDTFKKIFFHQLKNDKIFINKNKFIIQQYLSKKKTLPVFIQYKNKLVLYLRQYLVSKSYGMVSSCIMATGSK